MTPSTHTTSCRMLPGLLVAACAFLAGCFSSSNAVYSTFDSLKRGMSSTQVSRTLGSPDAVVGELTTAFGQRVVVWEYEKLTSLIPTEHEIYWVYLVEGRFQKFTLRGDWRREKELLFRTEFSPAEEP